MTEKRASDWTPGPVAVMTAGMLNLSERERLEVLLELPEYKRIVNDQQFQRCYECGSLWLTSHALDELEPILEPYKERARKAEAQAVTVGIRAYVLKRAIRRACAMLLQASSGRDIGDTLDLLKKAIEE